LRRTSLHAAIVANNGVHELLIEDRTDLLFALIKTAQFGFHGWGTLILCFAGASQRLFRDSADFVE
jgi:cell division protein FtsW (lipid II flippase)